ncbi:MAG: hypothetical protein ACN6O1_10420 [Comamonas sp.]|uniref:hypothetical protein n=1 Tax=Comamonas sp. TaxID=34028 RepID=UPI003D0B1863
MAENNSSAPLKNASMIEAFEAAYSRDWSDPAGDEIKEIWHRAWQAAVEAQAAPAAVAGLDHTAMHDALLWLRSALDCKDWHWSPEQRDCAELAYHASIAALPATEDSSAGDLAEASHQTKLLAQALGDCILASGIVRSDLDMSGPQLLMFAEDLKELLLAGQAEVQAEPVADSFLEWFAKNYPTDTIIIDPAWHAKSIYRMAMAHARLAALQALPADALDAAFEAVRKRFCKLPRYSFLLDGKGNVRRVPSFTGNWVEFEAAHTLFDPVAVDAAMAAAQEGGNAAKEA